MNYAALLERWNSLTVQVKILYGSIFALFIIAAVALPMFFLRNTQVPLFARPLSSDQLNEVDAQLSAWQVPFSTGTENVMVERSQRGDLLLKLSMVGIPHQDLSNSSDALSKVGALTPQSVLDVQTRDALANDLALALRGMAGIADARVIIAPAKDAFFADEESHQASASVRLTMQTGRTLSRDEIDGVRRFVANGVSGLDAAHVAVLDDSGMSLGQPSAATTEPDQGAGKDVEATVQSALDKALGAGLSIVRVHTDYSKAARQEYTYKTLPVAGDAISKVYTDERLAGKDRAYSKVHANEHRGSQGVATRSDIGPGVVERLSVAVFIDQSLEDEEPEIRSLVSAAAGINASRGDVLTVAPLVFHHIAATPMIANGQSALLLTQLMPGIIVGLTLVGVLLVAMQPILAILRRNANREILSNTKVLDAGIDIAAIWRTIHGEPAHVAAAVISQLPTSAAVAVLDMYPEAERREITERLARPIAPVLVDIVKVPSHA